MRADLIELDPDHPALVGHSPVTILDAWVFSGPSGAVRNVMVGGQWVFRDGHHVNAELITRDFRTEMTAVARVFGGVEHSGRAETPSPTLLGTQFATKPMYPASVEPIVRSHRGRAETPSPTLLGTVVAAKPT